MNKNLLKTIEAGVLNFLRRVEHKLPLVLTSLAQDGLNYTMQALDILNGKQAGQIEALVPDTEPFADEIRKILKGLESSFKALAKAGAPAEPQSPVSPLYYQETFEKGLLFAAAGAIASVKHESQLPMNRYNLAVQAEYSTHPESAANIEA